ncbi:uncharacterized protein LOC110466489 [Mizuhopecten yessoensis]|uniref:uncharacterized protein LOC110466489 n=1 Tax=Mizuhopecten yessoensis TaxID=6573 RepID=UPI000B45A0D6|nr:uncharacterized protein LOC110466489 [Mizuhopecten yessoensis]
MVVKYKCSDTSDESIHVKTPKKEMTQNHRPEVQSYNSNMVTNEIDCMDRELLSLKETMNKQSVRCHMLQVDLATLFSPDKQAVLRATKEDCIKCSETLQTHENDQLSSMMEAQ